MIFLSSASVDKCKPVPSQHNSYCVIPAKLVPRADRGQALTKLVLMKMGSGERESSHITILDPRFRGDDSWLFHALCHNGIGVDKCKTRTFIAICRDKSPRGLLLWVKTICGRSPEGAGRLL